MNAPFFNPFPLLLKVKLTKLQKEIGTVLLKGPKTAEEIAEELNADLQDVLEALKGLLVLRLVVKEGTPPRYSLAPHIREALNVDETRGILIHAVIEVEGVEEEALKKALDEIVKRLEEERGFVVKHVAVEEIEKDEETNVYYSHIDATILFPNLESLTYFLFFYGPTVVEVLSTDKIDVDPGDLQRAVVIAINMIHGDVTYITRLMTKKELEEFNKELFRRLKG